MVLLTRNVVPFARGSISAFEMLGGVRLNSRQPLRATASLASGGHGTRTRNRLPGTTFPVSPLAIRLPSGGKIGAASHTKKF